MSDSISSKVKNKISEDLSPTRNITGFHLKIVTAIAIVHLILSMVYGAGGLLHSLTFPGDMQDSEVLQARKFKLEWDNPDNQTFILGHHLIFLGVANIQFVEWARIHGIWDAAAGSIRQVEYNLNLSSIWNHQFDFLSINNLEDVMGGHAFLAFFMITGGAFHIATKQVGEYFKFGVFANLLCGYVECTSGNHEES